jgi:hypothetical protein
MNSDLISKASDTSSVSKIFPCGWRHSKLPKKGVSSVNWLRLVFVEDLFLHHCSQLRKR